ncbi:MAG: glutamate racemase [Acutalibacteraceae bacterium]
MDNRPIGIFDSGLGGLTAVRQLLRLLPGEDIVYFGDTGRVPYGNRSRETIARYARQDCRFLLENDVKLLIAACGTVSSAAADILEEMPVPAFGVVEPAAKAAVEATHSGRIGVIGTSATVRSGAFQRCITDLRQDVQVIMQACPLFVPLVENGWIDREDPVARGMAERYLQPLREQRIDTLILGCTHFRC